AQAKEHQPYMSTSSQTAKPDLSSLRIDRTQRDSGKGGKRWGIVVAALVVLALIAGAAWALRDQKPVVEVAIAQKASTGRPALLNASGYVTPRRRATVAAKITGRVTGVFFDEGVHGKEGQILATLDDSDVKRALESAVADRNSTRAQIADLEVQLKNAEIEMQRAKALLSAGVQSQETLDNATTAVDSLKAKIALTKVQVAGSEARIAEAQQAVNNCVIRAPFDGVAVSKDAQVGEMISPVSAGGGFTRTGVATIVDMNSNEIEVDVNEAYIARVEPGQPVTAILDAYPDWQIPAKVRTVIPTADRQKATVKVRISFLKLDPKILPDMGVKVTFLGDEPDKQVGVAPAALIPSGAVRDESGRKIVFLVKDNQLERRAVTIGNARGNDAEIMAGVTAGDTVVVKGPADLHDGEAVQIKK
ncbi:MAG: efflux RND transporter periplasmic adaptor subunit, partial [Candidatus Acidiferrales bacterium]